MDNQTESEIFADVVLETAQKTASMLISRVGVLQGILYVMNMYAFSHTKTGMFKGISDDEQLFHDMVSLATITELTQYERIQ